MAAFKPAKGDHPGTRWERFREWLTDLLDRLPTSAIVYEQAHHRGRAATHCAHALISLVEEVAAFHDVPVVSRHSATIKRHATGNGRASKAEMLAAARKAWPEKGVTSDDEADALWLLHLFLCDQR